MPADVELTKASPRDSRLKQWIRLLENAGREGDTMKTVFSENSMLSAAYEQFERCTQDEQLRELALAREKFQRDVATRLESAEQAGLEKGMEKARLEDARKLKSLGVSIDIIVKATGISREIVETL